MCGVIPRPDVIAGVDDVSLPMWMPGQCSDTTFMLVLGMRRPRAGPPATPSPQLEVYPTPYGDVTQVLVPPKVYETVQALGYHCGGICTPRTTKSSGTGG